MRTARSVISGALVAAALALPAVCSAALIGTLAQVSPIPTVYVEGIDFDNFQDTSGAAEGDVTAALQAVDPSSLDSGCQAADFAGFVPGRIALIRRGDCTFAEKILNAAAAGASGALVYNNVPGGGVLEGNLLTVPTLIPALFLSTTLGDAFVANSFNTSVHMTVTRVPDSSIPEPGAIALLGLGLAGLFIRRRRQI